MKNNLKWNNLKQTKITKNSLRWISLKYLRRTQGIIIKKPRVEQFRISKNNLGYNNQKKPKVE